MGHIEAKQQLNATPAAIWKLIADPSTWDDWFTIHAAWLSVPPTTINSGDRLVQKIVMLGMANKLEWTVDEVVEPSRVAMSGTGMAGVKVAFAFEVTPTDTGSEFAVTGDFEGALIKGALGKAVEKDFGAQLDATIARLENLAAV